MALDSNPWSPDRDSRARYLGGTARSRVAHELRDRIIVGDLRPGARIDLDEIARDLGTSRTPIREACLELAHDGLVLMAPRSGITVIGISRQDLLENFSIMMVLAGMAASWAALRMTPDKLARISAHADAVRQAIAEDGPIAEANWQFHRQINLASDSPRLMAHIAQSGRLIPANFFKLFPSQTLCAVDEHAGLVDALGARDHQRAQKLMEDHYANARELLSSHFHVDESHGEPVGTRGVDP